MQQCQLQQQQQIQMLDRSNSNRVINLSGQNVFTSSTGAGNSGAPKNQNDLNKTR